MRPSLSIRLERRHARGAGQRVPAVSQARVEHLVLEPGSDIAREITTAPSGSAAPVSPLASVIMSGACPVAVALPREPLAAASERAHDLVRDQQDVALARHVA